MFMELIKIAAAFVIGLVIGWVAAMRRIQKHIDRILDK